MITLVRGIGRLFTAGEAGALTDAALTIDGELVSWVGPDAEVDPSLVPDDEVDLDGALVTPGLIDSHTHPLYGGERFAEIALRSAGASYSEIAASGGGIASTVAATREASPDELGAALDRRLAAWLAGGATTIEAKTGYHLFPEGEIEAVRLLAARSAGGRGGPAVEVTYLGGHGVGPEWAGDADGYSDEVARSSAAAREAGARHADVFCDEGYFTIEQGRRMLSAAITAGLIARIHADDQRIELLRRRPSVEA